MPPTDDEIEDAEIERLLAILDLDCHIPYARHYPAPTTPLSIKDSTPKKKKRRAPQASQPRPEKK